ncbi:hypothetical protein [Dysgonomonas alginatilytica]|nr:hypothetical protein [Dysgonomonas alginatilytica]
MISILFIKPIRYSESGDNLQRKVNATLREIDYNIDEIITGIRESEVPNFYAHFWEKHLQYLQ